jgi:hypothetical protein
LRFAPSRPTILSVTSTAKGTFSVDLVPAAAELGGAVARFELAKHFHGDLEGSGAGVMLSGGDPQAGMAGYVAIETVTGRLGERTGSLALQQFGTMHDGTQTLHYEVVPGSGSGGLAGITGTLSLTIDADGSHHYVLEYQLPA